jgi:ATP-dependent RNA helicase CshB
MNPLITKMMEINNFKTLTKVQDDVLKAINKPNDLIVMAPTGTGKTHSFLFSILESLNFDFQATQAVIIAPTRELAMQISDFSKSISKVVENVTLDLAIGGMDNARLKKKLAKQPQILITTPGKFLDVLEWNILRLDTIKLCIIDEMDMMFDYGFVDDINTIASRMIDATRFMLFSATLPQSLNVFIKNYLNKPIQIQSADVVFKPQIDHILVHRTHKSLEESVLDVLASINPSLAIVFANTKDEVVGIAKYLREYGIECVEIHGDVSDRGRTQIIKRIRSGHVRYIVATDLAARGIDLPEISHVINANIPTHDLTFYTHRAGRTGRTGRQGYCISFVDDSDQNAISRLMNQNIDFKFMRIRNNQLLEARPFFNFEKRTKRIDPEILSKTATKKKKVKPGYKRKRKVEMEKLMRKKRRDTIRADIRAQKKERAKARQRLHDQD